MHSAARRPQSLAIRSHSISGDGAFPRKKTNRLFDSLSEGAARQLQLSPSRCALRSFRRAAQPPESPHKSLIQFSRNPHWSLVKCSRWPTTLRPSLRDKLLTVLARDPRVSRIVLNPEQHSRKQILAKDGNHVGLSATHRNCFPLQRGTGHETQSNQHRARPCGLRAGERASVCGSTAILANRWN